MPPRSHPCAALPCSPALRVLVLFWALLLTTLAPAGATLHVISHISPGALAGAAMHADGHHEHPPHCHDCDEWQVLDYAITAAALPVAIRPKLALPIHAVPATASISRTPWILPRAPPARV
jgi:hypothetical protein